MGGARGVAVALAAVAIAAAAWALWPESDERAIRRRLDAAAEEANTRSGEGLEAVAKAARVGAYFTEDVVAGFGAGAPPVSGRQTLIAMATRLQAPAASLVVSLEDITVVKRPDTGIADVALTATITRTDTATGERTMDAREFALEMRKEGGAWLIARVTAVDTLR